jgi:hypothetical protein
MEKFSAIGKSKIKNINVKSEGDMKKKMSITMTKLMFAIPMAFFALRLIVQYIVGHHEEDPEMLQKALRSMICFFMTACATTFYKGKGDFIPFTLNARGVISLIMLVTPFVLNFISMWIDRKEQM